MSSVLGRGGSCARSTWSQVAEALNRVAASRRAALRLEHWQGWPRSSLGNAPDPDQGQTAGPRGSNTAAAVSRIWLFESQNRSPGSNRGPLPYELGLEVAVGSRGRLRPRTRQARASNQEGVRPRATATASSRKSTPRARKRRRMWFLTVSVLRWSSAAICLVESGPAPGNEAPRPGEA